MAKKSSATTSRRRQLLLRFLALSAAALVVIGLLGAVAFHFFEGWRSRDLARKALVNLESANYRMAWLQTTSARALRPDDPEVLRTAAIVDAAFGRKESLDAWKRLAETQTLSAEDQEQRARAAIRFQEQEQLQAALEALEAAGSGNTATELRAANNLSRGDLDKTIEEARRGAATSGNPALKLDLARLLLRRYAGELSASSTPGAGPRQAYAEMVAIINSLQNDPEIGSEALAFGLTFLLPGAENQKAWADLAMARMEAGNPALLPAAAALIDNKHDSLEKMYARLRPVFDAAPLDRRAAFAGWLVGRKMPKQALTLITAQEAGETVQAFVARTGALGDSGNWEAVVTTCESGGNVPEWLRLVTRARADYALRSDAASGPKSVAAAIRAAAKEQALPVAVQTADQLGAPDVVSDALVELCGSSASAAPAFGLARQRFAASGDPVRMKAAFERASMAAPDDIVVRDYARYSAMIEDPSLKPDLEGAAEAAVAAPADPLIRVTESLANLRAGQPQEALRAFTNLTVFYNRLPPGPQAVLCAVLAANGQRERAAWMVKSIDVAKLSSGEKALIDGLR
jgi:hypothetical protein